MKKRCILAMAAVLSVICISSSVWAGNVVKAGTCDWPPYYGETLENGGFMTEITREAFKRAGWDYQVEFMNWNRAEGLCKQGKLDMVQGGFYTDERAKDYLLTEVYSSVEIVFFKKKGADITYGKLEDLKGKKIGLIRGWIYPDAITKSDFLTVEYVDKPLSNIKKMFAGRVDLIVGSKAVVIDTANRELPDQAGLLVPLAPPVKANPVHNIISRKIANGQAVAEAFNRGLGMIQADGTYDAILKKHGF